MQGDSGTLSSWLRPEYVRIDMHFIQGINSDPVKLQFVRSIRAIAERSGTRVIAEDIGIQAEFLVLRDLDEDCGQGYHLARPAAKPAPVDPDAAAALRDKVISISSRMTTFMATARATT